MENKNQMTILQIQNKTLDRIISYVGLILMVFLLFKSCNNQKEYASILIDSDTVINNTFIRKDTTINRVPRVDTVYPYIVRVTDTQWMPSPDYTALIRQYEEIRNKYLGLNVTKDTIPIDTIGVVLITDTINQNKIIGRAIVSSLKIPVKTVTITNTNYVPHKNIWMWGANVGGNQDKFVKQIGADIMLITKKDRGYRVGVKIGLDGKPIYEGGIYFKF